MADVYDSNSQAREWEQSLLKADGPQQARMALSAFQDEAARFLVGPSAPTTELALVKALDDIVHNKDGLQNKLGISLSPDMVPPGTALIDLHVDADGHVKFATWNGSSMGPQGTTLIDDLYRLRQQRERQ
jgi:hypothetical protein